MSSVPQPGQHPDADALSCFVERALPVHEREQILAHLAICPQCRRVVALALPEAEDTGIVDLAPARRRWFASWRLAVPVAGVCAAGLFIALLTHRSARSRARSAPQVRLATTAGHPDPRSLPSERLSPPPDGTALASAEPLLPSHLPVLSKASSGHRALAIDTQHALFLSGDAGQHWQSIVSPWRGQAIDVRLVQAASDSSRGIATVGLAGKVLDASGVAIRSAFLVLHDSGTNAERSAVTDDDGRYQIDKLVPGIYSLAIQAAGFNRKRIEGIDLFHAPGTATDITLSVGSASETVIVTGPATADGRGPANVRQPRSVMKSRFQITTDTGEFWLSGDGLAWRRQPTIPQEQ